MNRRSFLRGLIAAPAIVAVSNIMPVRAIDRLIVPPQKPRLSAMLELGDLIQFDGRTFKVTEITMSSRSVIEYGLSGFLGERGSFSMSAGMMRIDS